jgi:hypothetical protein
VLLTADAPAACDSVCLHLGSRVVAQDVEVDFERVVAGHLGFGQQDFHGQQKAEAPRSSSPGIWVRLYRCARGCPGARRGPSIPASGFVLGDAGKARFHC